MTDWTTAAELATAAGTMTLAVATFASVRSANRAARTAERAFQVALRPVLMPSRAQDHSEPVMWREGRWSEVKGGRAVVEVDAETVFLIVSLRNAGSGIAVLQAWTVRPGQMYGSEPPPPIETFRRQQRDLYVPAGDVGFWQGALRGADEPLVADAQAAVAAQQTLTLHLLYSDHEGGQRTVSRFLLVHDDDPTSDADWLVSVSNHWAVTPDGTLRSPRG